MDIYACDSVQCVTLHFWCKGTYFMDYVVRRRDYCCLVRQALVKH